MNKNVVITILLVIVLCLGGYLVFDKVIDKKDNKVEQNKIDENNNSSVSNNKYVEVAFSKSANIKWYLSEKILEIQVI